MSTIPSIPPGTDLTADAGPRIIAANITLIVLPTIFVILRFVSRKIARAGLWWDDALVTAALIFSWGPCISVIISQRTNSFGRHLWVLPNPAHNTSQFLKILYIYIILFYFAIVLIKFSILAFYRRIFPVSQLKFPLLVAYGLITAFGVGTLLVFIFACQPIHRFWDPGTPGKCVDTDTLLLATSAINCALDFLIVGLPIPLLWKLRTTTSQKGVLTGIFVCAGFACIISIIRLVVLSRLTAFDVTWNYVNAAIWSAAEPCMGVIAACLPSLRPLVAVLVRGTHRGPTMHGKSSQNISSTSSSRMVWSRRDRQGDELDTRDSIGGFTRLEDHPLSNSSWSHDVRVKGGRDKRSRSDRKKPLPGDGDDQISLEEMVPQGGIKVKSEVVITTSEWEYKDRLF